MGTPLSGDCSKMFQAPTLLAYPDYEAHSKWYLLIYLLSGSYMIYDIDISSKTIVMSAMP